MATKSSAHVLVFPHPAQGHLIPLLDLTYHLSTRGVTITVLVTPKNLPLLDPLLSRSPSIKTLVLPFPAHPSIPPGVENIKDLGHASSTAPIVRALSALRDPIARWFHSHPSPPVAIISGFFLGWTQDLAAQLGVPRFVFYASGPHVISVLNDLWTSPDVRPPGPITLSGVPGSPSFDYSHLPSVYRKCQVLGSPGSDWEFMKEGLIANMKSFGGVYNTFYALEGTYIEHMRKHGGHERNWAVGPLFVGVGSDRRGGSTSLPDGDVMTWLDNCLQRSVVYVCFGSEVSLTRPQMDEVAAGLERSGARFVWAVRVKEGDGSGLVPEGFEERTAGKGLVIRGWAPQTSILGHRAVGAFLTHCGWNSVLEGLVSAVRLLAWPMGADQFLNARLLVEETGIAVRVCEGLETIPNSAELARVVAESLSGNGAERARAMEFRKAALDAVKEGGSSCIDLDGLVEELSAINLKKTSGKKEGICKGNCLERLPVT